MRVGCFTPLLSQFPLEKVFDKLKKLNISTVELGTGNYPGDPHCKLSMLQNENELKEFKKKLDDQGFSISALSCHGNPLHPDAAIAKGFADTSKRTVELAAKLGVPVVIDFSGCPGDSDSAKYPELGDVPVADGIPGCFGMAVGQEGYAVLERTRQVCQRSWCEDCD